ncbi:MAG: four-helix bundle copper-binding protein [Pirellulales bacterium]
MTRRDVIGALGVTAFTLGTYGAVRAQTPAAKAADPHAGHAMGGPMEACAKACADCMLECQSCRAHCEGLVAGGKKEHVATMKLCGDCAEICGAAAGIVSRGGPLSALICEACAKACDECGKACAQFPDDDHMKQCADACKKCATACRDMLKHASMKH